MGKQIKKQTGGGGGVTGITAGDWISIDKSTPTAPIVSVDFEPIPITLAALATADDGLYILTDGNNIGLVVWKEDGEVQPTAYIVSGSAGSQTVDLGGAVAGGDATGLANNATVYTASISVDGTPNPISVTGSAAQTYTDLLTEINADLTGAVASLLVGNLAVASSSTGSTSLIAITDIDLFSSLTQYVGVNAATDGSTYSLRVDYDFVNDVINTYYDANSNSVNATNGVIDFPFNSTVFQGNDFTQDGGSNFFGSQIAACFYNNHYDGSFIVATGFSGQYKSNKLYNQTSIDLSLNAGDFIGNKIDINGNTFTPNKPCSGLTITTETSNYQNDFTLTSNTIDANETAGHNWSGILQTTAGTLNDINNPSLLPKNIHLIAPASGILEVTNAGNIKVPETIYLQGEGFIDLILVGARYYPTAISSSTYGERVATVTIAAADVITLHSSPVSVTSIPAIAGFKLVCTMYTNALSDMTVPFSPLGSGDVYLQASTASDYAWRGAGLLNASADFDGYGLQNFSVSNTIIENDGFVITADDDCTPATGDATYTAQIRYCYKRVN